MTPPPRRTPRSRRRGSPGMRVCVLGSGSGGNSTVLHVGEAALLIDAGFGPKTTRRRLAQARLELEQVRAVCLTHLDQDHFRRSWPRTLLRLGIRLYLHHFHLPDLARLRGSDELFNAGLVDAFDTHPFHPLPDTPGFTARTVRLQHDRQGTVGYRFDARPNDAGADNFVVRASSLPSEEGGQDARTTSRRDARTTSECDILPTQRHHGSIAYATDLGHVPAAMVDHFAGADLLCLEANYDEHMTTQSSRPAFVNRRNLSDSGHLSNEQALEAVRRIAAASPHGNPRQVVLLHRSSQCNHEMKLRRVFERHPWLDRRVTLTQQRRRSKWFAIRPQPAAHRGQGVLKF